MRRGGRSFGDPFTEIGDLLVEVGDGIFVSAELAVEFVRLGVEFGDVGFLVLNGGGEVLDLGGEGAVLLGEFGPIGAKVVVPAGDYVDLANKEIVGGFELVVGWEDGHEGEGSEGVGRWMQRQPSHIRPVIPPGSTEGGIDIYINPFETSVA